MAVLAPTVRERTASDASSAENGRQLTILSPPASVSATSGPIANPSVIG
jgi:hypothetical protein